MYTFNLLSLSLVDFVLKDPRQKGLEKEPRKLPHRQELDVVPKPWAKSVISAFQTMSQTLFVTNPTLNQVLSSWYRSFGHLRLVSATRLLTHPDVFELTAFQSKVVKDIEAMKNVLLKK